MFKKPQSLYGNKVQFTWTCNYIKKNIEIKLDYTDCCCDVGYVIHIILAEIFYELSTRN